MAIEQEQFYCPQCDRLTLHQRPTYQVPHGVHFGFTVLSCGLWLPIWALHAILGPLLDPAVFRCAHCGQVAGGLTAEEAEAARSARRQRWQQRARAIDATARGAGRLAWAGLRGFRRAWVGTANWLAARTADFDAWLRAAFGEEGAVLYRTCQLLVYGVLPLALLWLAWQLR